MEQIDDQRRRLLRLLDRHRLLFLFFADANRFNPLEDPYRIERVDERDQATFRFEEIDCDGEFLFEHRSRLDRFADSAIAKFGTGNGQRPKVLAGSRLVEVEGGGLPVWRVNDEGCRYLNESAETIVECCQALNQQFDCILPQGLLSHVMHAVYDEGKPRWNSASFVTWAYLSNLDEKIHAVRTEILGEVGSRHLGITLGDREATRIVNGDTLTIKFGRKMKPWDLFRELFFAGDDGLSRGDIQKRLWRDRPVSPNALDQLKRRANESLEDIRIEISPDNHGVWRLADLDS